MQRIHLSGYTFPFNVDLSVTKKCVLGAVGFKEGFFGQRITLLASKHDPQQFENG
ncbi:hypothetical protein D3C78_1954110 [compost metagenome]